MTDTYKTYEFTIKIKTNRKVKEELWRLYQRLKDVAKILSIEYELIDERPPTIEHHGGNNDST
tara:strand:+ start:183 stop:371 length:189 start_codon:yes stop_codon:yes gene_type:complete